MNARSLFALLLLCFALAGIGQNNFTGFNYQAVVRNATGDPLPNQAIGVRVQMNPTGSNGYTERHTVTTDANGQVKLVMGEGTPEVGSTVPTFAGLDWTSGAVMNYTVSVDITGGTTYTALGSGQFKSVPFALRSLTSGGSAASVTQTPRNSSDSTTGSVGIGTNTPGAKLDVNGRARINGATVGRGFGTNDSTSTVLGVRSLASGSTSPRANTAIGYETMASNTLGNTSWNTAVGYRALRTPSSNSYENNAFGYNCLTGNTTGVLNAAFGSTTMELNTTGNFNSAFGNWSLRFNTSGSENVGLGYRSLEATTTGGFNTACGARSLRGNSTGTNNTALGSLADVASGALTNATAIGANALATQSNTLVLGSINGVNGATADVNVGIGTSTPAAKLDVIGRALINGLTVGRGLGIDSTTTVVGVRASPTVGSEPLENVIMGYEAMNSNGAYGCAAVGYKALQVTSGGGDHNSAFGYQSLTSNTNGFWNCASGAFALTNNTTGDLNNAVGYNALAGNSNGNGNTAVGHRALQSNASGNYNTAVGYRADVNSGSLINATAIGANALATQSNTLILGSINGVNQAASDVNVGIGTSNPTQKLDVVSSGDAFVRTSTTNGTSKSGLILSKANAADWSLHPEPVNGVGNLMLDYAGSTKFFVEGNTGEVGIGTITPSQKLDVISSGDAFVRTSTTNGTSQSGLIMSKADAGDWILHIQPVSNVANLMLDYNGSTKFFVEGNTGEVGIGTTNPQSKLAVNGTITCKEVNVTLAGFPDYVFRPGYDLMPLDEVADYIDANGHLPNAPIDCEVEENGIGLGELNKILLEKIEELTLHMIEKDQQILELRGDLSRLMDRTEVLLHNAPK